MEGYPSKESGTEGPGTGVSISGRSATTRGVLETNEVHNSGDRCGVDK